MNCFWCCSLRIVGPKQKASVLSCGTALAEVVRKNAFAQTGMSAPLSILQKTQRYVMETSFSNPLFSFPSNLYLASIPWAWVPWYRMHESTVQYQTRSEKRQIHGCDADAEYS